MKLKNAKRFISILCISGIVFSLPLITACDNGNGGGSDAASLTVVSTYPVGNSEDVAINSMISVTFSEAVDPATVDTGSFIISSGTDIIGTVSLSSDNKTAVFTPDTDLSYNTDYTVTLKSTITGLSDNSIGDDFDFIFTTGAAEDLVKPTVGINPVNASTGVPVSSDIILVFSEAMNSLTINNTNIKLLKGSTEVASVVSYDASTSAAVINPAEDLDNLTMYTVKVYTGVSDTSGNAIASVFTSAFETAGNTVPVDPVVIPTVDVSPVNAAEGVPVTQNIILTFSKAMNSLTINSTNIKLMKGNTEVASAINYYDTTNIAVINPAADLDYSTLYTVKVYTGAADASGNVLAAEFTSAFKTAAYIPPIDPVEIVKLLFVGDINLGTKVGESVVSNGGGDYNFIFSPVASYIKSFDLAIGNLESIISDKGTTTKPVTGVDLRADPAAVNGLVGAGFDIVNVANNHAGDFGEAGMVDSFSRLTAAGIDFVGGGINYTAARKPVIKEIKGIKIACLGYTNVQMYMDSWYAGQVPTSRWIATNSRPGVAWAHDTRFENFGSVADMTADVKAARANADVVVVIVHFGMEYQYVPTQEQKDWAHAAIDAGAVMVIGHHPHVCQTVEEYKGGFIAYSLGNFVFDISEDMAAGTTKGLVVEATFTNGKMTNVHTRDSRIDQYYQVSLIED